MMVASNERANALRVEDLREAARIERDVRAAVPRIGTRATVARWLHRLADALDRAPARRPAALEQGSL